MLDQLIDAKIAERDRLKALATNVSSKPIDGMPFSNTNEVSQTMQNAVINLIMLEGELDKLIDTYIDKKQSVLDVLEKLPEAEYGVIHRHYIRYMTWEQVAEDMNYSTTHVWRIKKNAIMLLNVMLDSGKMVL
jgi:DNA-directed RNA polymerase specialized sigma subunit